MDRFVLMLAIFFIVVAHTAPGTCAAPVGEMMEIAQTHTKTKGARQNSSTPRSAIPSNPSGNTPNVDCSRKPYCKTIATCEEAYAFLQQCGLKRLDRDSDGLPCESGPC